MVFTRCIQFKHMKHNAPMDAPTYTWLSACHQKTKKQEKVQKSKPLPTYFKYESIASQFK